MTRKIMFIAFLLGFQLLCFSQNNNTAHILGVMNFTAAKAEQTSSAGTLQEIITEVLSTKKYITLLDRSKVDQIEQELKKQKQGNYIDGVTVEQNKSFGAKELLNGTLTVLNVDESTKTDNTSAVGGAAANVLLKRNIAPVRSTTKTSYKARISFALQVVDVETGKIISGKSFELNSGSSGSLKFDAPPSYNSEDEARSNAFKDNKKQIMALVNDWFNSVYPPPLVIATIDERDKGGFPSKISIVGGTEANLKPGNDLVVYEVTELVINGEKKRKKVLIGALQVKETQGDFTLCKVKDGEKILEQKWKENVIQIELKSTEK